MVYRQPHKWNVNLIDDKKNGKPFIKKNDGYNIRRGADAYTIWENLRDEILKEGYIRKDSEGRHWFPVSGWFTINRGDISAAFYKLGGYTKVVRRLINENLLARNYIPASDNTENAEPRKSYAKSISDWENLCEFMVGVCKRLGKFPKQPKEMVDLGYMTEMSVIRNNYTGLPYIEELMRKEGRLDFLKENKKIEGTKP